MRSGFKSCALEPLLTGLCINMMHAVASYLCRGIEAVITGLTRNQFVDNTTRGFESLPLRQRFNLTHSGWIEPFFLAQRKRILTMRRSRRVRIRGAYLRREEHFASPLTLAERLAQNIPRAAYPSLKDTPCGCPYFVQHIPRFNLRKVQTILERKIRIFKTPSSLL